MTERVLTSRELNRATLARQMLLERKRLSPTRVIERLVGMQAQWPAAPYVGIWTRATSFRRDALERELRRGAVVKATMMRLTLHLVTVRDYAVFRSALSERNFPWESELAGRLAPAVRALGERADGVTSEEGVTLVTSEEGLVGIEARRAWRYARVRAHVLHHHETALWNARPAGRFVAIGEPEEPDPTEARAELLRRYFAAFGPASRRDIAAWSMMSASQIQRALDLLEPLLRFRGEDGRELLDIPRAPLPDDVPAPVRFLPKWDNLLLAYADRTRVLPDEYRRVVIGQNGDVAQTFLVDGVVAGKWRLDGGKVVVEPFAPLPRVARREVEDEATRLAAFLTL